MLYVPSREDSFARVSFLPDPAFRDMNDIYLGFVCVLWFGLSTFVTDSNSVYLTSACATYYLRVFVPFLRVVGWASGQVGRWGSCETVRSFVLTSVSYIKVRKC